MNEKNVRRKGDNSGLTLVELVVTIGIIAIFSGVILAFITSGSGFYRSTSNNAKVQMDTQELLDDMEDLIIDTNRSVYYSYGPRADVVDDSARIPNDNDIDVKDSRDKSFFICNQYETQDGIKIYYDILEWQASDQTVYYCRVPGDDINKSVAASLNTQQEGGEGSTFSSGEDLAEAAANAYNASRMTEVYTSVPTEQIDRSVYATGITHFNADVSKVETERVVRFQLATDSGGKEIETIHTVNLRNKIVIEKPDKQAATGNSDDVSIVIKVYPPYMEAGGKPEQLSYKLVGDGDIDANTVVWNVNEPGYFSQDKLSSGILAVRPNGTGTLEVTVSAVTTKGKPITSVPVFIPVINNKQPSDLVPSVNSVLVGAGNSVDLNTLITWEQKYEDGTTDSDDVVVEWSTESSYATLSKEGWIVIRDDVGTSDTGSFNVTAKNPETGSKGTVIVNIARVDIIGVNEVTSNVNMSYAAIYTEAGNTYKINSDDISVNGHNIGWTLEDKQNNEEYMPSDKPNFSKVDNGDWTIKVEVNLGFSTVFSSKEFKVSIIEPNYKIVGPSIVTAEETYQMWKDWYIVDTTTGEEISGHNNWPLSIVDSSDVTIKGSQWDNYIDVYINGNAETFTIKVNTPDWLWDVAGAKYLTYDVKVVKLIGIVPPETSTEIGDSVTLTPYITVGGSAADDEAKKQLTYNWALNNKPQEWGQLANWTIGDDALKENMISLQIKMPDGRNVYCPNKSKDRTETSTITVDYAVDFSLIANDDYKKIFAGESAGFTSLIKINGKIPQDLSKYPVTWKCEKIDEGGASTDVLDTLKPSGKLAGEQTTFNPEEFGKYKISVSVEALGQTFEAEPYEINVDEVKFSIKQKEHIKDIVLNSELAFYPELLINGKTPDNLEDYNIDWKCEEIKGDEEYQQNDNLIERADNGTLNFKPTNRGKYKLSAVVTVDGREYQASYVVDVHQVRFEVRETLNKRSAVVGEALNFWLYLEIDGKEVSSMDERVTVVWNENSVVNGSAIPGQQNRIKYTIPQDASDTVSASATLTAFGQQTFQSQYDITVAKLKVNIVGDVYQQIYLEEDKNFSYTFDYVVMESVNGDKDKGDIDVTDDYVAKWSLKIDNKELSDYVKIDASKGVFSIDSNEITEPFIVEIKVQLKEYEEIFDTRIIYVFPKETLRETVYIEQGDEESLNCPGVPGTEKVKGISLVVRYDDKHIEYPTVNDFEGLTIIQGKNIPLKIKISNDEELLKTISSIELSLNFDTKLFVYTIIPQFYNVYHGSYKWLSWNHREWVIDDDPAEVYIPAPETLLMMGSRVDSYTYSWAAGTTRCELRQSSSDYAGRGLWIIKYQDDYYAYIEGKWEQRPLGWFWFLKALVSRKL